MMKNYFRTVKKAWFTIAVLGVGAAAGALPGKTFAQDFDVKKVVFDLEPQIRRAMIEGKISSATIAMSCGVAYGLCTDAAVRAAW